MLEKSDIKALCTLLKSFVFGIQRKKTHWCVFPEKSVCVGGLVFPTSIWFIPNMTRKNHAHLRGFLFQDCHRHSHFEENRGTQSMFLDTNMCPYQADLIISTAILKFGATIFASMTFTPYPVLSTWDSGYSKFLPEILFTVGTMLLVSPKITFSQGLPSANSLTLFGKLSSPIIKNNLKLACCTTPKLF